MQIYSVTTLANEWVSSGQPTISSGSLSFGCCEHNSKYLDREWSENKEITNSVSLSIVVRHLSCPIITLWKSITTNNTFELFLCCFFSLFLQFLYTREWSSISLEECVHSKSILNEQTSSSAQKHRRPVRNVVVNCCCIQIHWFFVSKLTAIYLISTINNTDYAAMEHTTFFQSNQQFNDLCKSHRIETCK